VCPLLRVEEWTKRGAGNEMVAGGVFQNLSVENRTRIRKPPVNKATWSDRSFLFASAFPVSSDARWRCPRRKESREKASSRNRLTVPSNAPWWHCCWKVRGLVYHSDCRRSLRTSEATRLCYEPAKRNTRNDIITIRRDECYRTVDDTIPHVFGRNFSSSRRDTVIPAGRRLISFHVDSRVCFSFGLDHRDGIILPAVCGYWNNGLFSNGFKFKMERTEPWDF